MLNYFQMKPRSILSLSNFFGAAHFFLIIYVITPYLATVMPASETGLVVSLGAVVTLTLFPLMPKFVQKYGPRKLAIFFGIAEAFILAWLAIGPNPVGAIILVALACATTPLIDYQLDILLEATVAKENATGRIRTTFLTAGNLVLIISPLIVGLVMDSTESYWRVFAVASASLLPFIGLLLIKKLPEGKAPTFTSMMETCLCLMADRDLRAIAIAHGMLQFFYHLAPLYIPLYLHEVLHMPWSTLGWVFAVMLLPFVFLEYPAGWLADRKWGDQELLLAGFVITGAAFAALSLIGPNTMLIFIILLLVLTRVGASLVEAMSEGHFFRRVSEADATTVGLFRMTRPIAALIAPLIGSLILSVAGYGTLFVVTGAIILIGGVASALAIRDIR